ncbi:MAG: transcriptional regulator [Mycoplasmataceae bacterium RV_VA103A]|nr:MAG: transcriptional regulator [Mycoplasmataceae bacterium RV_VA103A]
MNDKTFIFKYDPKITLEGMFSDFWKATKGKLHLAKPHEISSPHIKAILTSINKEQWEMFDTLAKKKPSSLTELTKLVNRNYNDVLKDADVLESMGIIKLEKKDSEIKPVALYDRIAFDFGFQEPSLKDLKLEDKIVNNLLRNSQEISFLGSRDITSSQNSKKIKIPYKYHGIH